MQSRKQQKVNGQATMQWQEVQDKGQQLKGSKRAERQEFADKGQKVNFQQNSHDLISILQRQGLGNGDTLQHIDQADDNSVAQLLANLRYGCPPADC